MTPEPSYDPLPHYPPVDGTVERGWASAVAALPAGVRTLAVDGPTGVDWDGVVRELTVALAKPIELVDLRACGRPWAEIVAATSTAALGDDPNFEALAGCRRCSSRSAAWC